MSFDQESGSETAARYQDFALRTYTDVRANIKTALDGAVADLPVLVIIGESHLDTQQERDANLYTADYMEEPALASAFTEIAALEAAARIVGKENVVLSIESFPEKFPEKIEAIRENGGVPPAPYDQMPIWHTLAYAVNNGFEIVPTDTGNHYHETAPDLRDEMMIDAVASVSASAEDSPQIVVHVGGESAYFKYAWF